VDDRYGREVQIRDLTQRFVYALAGGVTRIDVPLPFSVRNDGDHVTPEPQVLLLIMRTLMTHLSGAVFRGKIPTASNVDAFLFDRNGEGLLVIWSREQQNDTKSLALNLGY